MTVQDTGRGIEMYNYWLAERQKEFKTSRKEGLDSNMAAFLSGMAEGRKRCADDLAVFLKCGEVEVEYISVNSSGLLCEQVEKEVQRCRYLGGLEVEV